MRDEISISMPKYMRDGSVSTSLVPIVECCPGCGINGRPAVSYPSRPSTRGWTRMRAYAARKIANAASQSPPATSTVWA